MSLILTQFSLSTSTVPVFTVPPGTSSFTVYNVGAGTAYLGMSTAITTTNSLIVHTVPTSIQGFPTSKGGQVYGFASTAGTFINLAMMTGQ